MKLRNLAIGAAAMSLAAAPAIAEIDLDRATAPVEGESEVGEAVYGVAGLAALATVLVLVTTDDDEQEDVSL
ncbi:hypothetical protein AAG596_09230 [Citromicrobium bathyomarinum]|uniref:hypothetical protein n=1 Tax=Citromicrobium TaxID=72173 RepID=UPI0004919704|nr:hypothetical protein [Citromicrobium sp. JLT1363]|tara:strand:- start:71 stop:286 length:216 start_codon:yes stop_codon:yes gene_type:complete